MASIRIPDNRSMESKELEVHVAMCEYRRTVMEDRMSKLEKQIEDTNNRAMMSKKLIVSSIVSVITGVVTTIFSIFLNYSFFKS